MKLSPLSIGVLLLFSALGGYALGRFQPAKTQLPASKIIEPKEKIANQSTVKLIESSTLFNNQNAIVLASFTRVNGRVATIKDRNGEESSFLLSPNLSIFTFTSDSNKPTISTNPQTIPLQKEASVALDFKDTQYQISSITFSAPQTVSIPPALPSTTLSPTK